MSRRPVITSGPGRGGETVRLRAGSSVDLVVDTPGADPGGTLSDDAQAGESAPLPSVEGLIAQAVRLAGEDLDAARLVSRYWRFAPDEDLIGRTPTRLLAAARAHVGLAAQRLPGQLKLRVTNPEGESHTLIEIVLDDMPFLVDSITAALTARGLDLHLLVHPMVVVRRTPLGALTEVAADVEPDDAIAGDLVESWIRIEVDRVRSADARRELVSELTRVLTDVREAVEDWPRMRAAALAIADGLASTQFGGPRPPVPDKDITDSVALLRWLADDNFTFLGYREYDLAGEELRARLGSGLGILRSDQVRPRLLSSMSPEARLRVLEKRLLIVTKANSRATVHRNAYLDYIGLKTFDADGNVTGERRFIGLFTSSAYRSSVLDLPVVSRKVHEVLERSGLSPRSHSGKDLLEILETYPRDELFSIATDDLYHAALGVLRMAGRRQLRVFIRRDHYGRFVSCLIYLPRDRFNTASRLRMQEILMRRLNGIGVDYATRIGESLLARVHFIVRTDPAAPPPAVDPDPLAEELAHATRLWDDDFRLVLEHALTEETGEEHLREEAAGRLFDRYATAFSEVYKEQQTPYEAIKDIAKLELLEEPGQLEMHLFRHQNDPDRVRFKVYRHGEAMTLSEVLPVLHSLGVRVTDEHPYEIARPDGTVRLYDFGLQLPADARDPREVRGHVENAFSAAFRGETEVDDFNALVLRAGLTWRQVVILRAYAKYLRQAGSVYSQEYLQSTLLTYPGITAQLVELFELRFDPARGGTPAERTTRAGELVEAIGRALDEVDNLDQDRMFRAYLTLIQATLRTSFFQRGPDGRPKSAVAFKLDPRAVPDLPQPRPRYEIFVYSPRFEGVHLRFGLVARGGLRWSDRREDFRTEVLGLVKAQAVKNAVIVPAGAKGGFVLKQPGGARPREEAQACYRQFVSALLDVTDNLTGGDRPDAVVVPPPEVLRYDGDDPYLVVAADKGTATFSDLANEISRERGFWLDDAFASGGSAGYDHKKMGITARGAWESVKRHLRELDIDLSDQDITVAGVGDMSGDVFGNGMLCSERIRLIAAFDHRHVFLDPDPDPAVSYAQRRRLFDTPGSTWDDYDRSLISEGGGVWPRTAKAVPVGPRVREALGLDAGVESLTPVELIRAILRAPVDLLFNGGIGTYVKASTESHAEVGDKANDALRIDGRQVRARMVVEGGNLGLTQSGRVEYALAGGRVFTDFIDNSAGVDCSDREVNIKILLAGTGLPRPERDTLLAAMTDDVAALVLADNYQQAASLGRAASQSELLRPVHRRMLTELERDSGLDRVLAGLPGDEELAARTDGLTTPELAVLMAYVKNLLQEEIVDSQLPDEEWTAEALAGYFPAPLRERFGEQLARHRLRREIVSLQLVNEMVNRAGTSFVYRAREETGAAPADVVRAYVVVRDVYRLDRLWAAVEALDGTVPVAAQTAVFLTTRRLLDRAVRWLLQNRRSPLDVPAAIAELRPGVAQLLPRLGSLYRGVERESLGALAESLAARGTPPELADWASRVVYGFGLLDIVEVAGRSGTDLTEAAEIYFVLSERFRVDMLLSRISALPREDRWQTLARTALRYDLYAALAALTAEVLAATAPGEEAGSRVFRWERRNAATIARARTAIGELDGAPGNLAALSVLLRQIRTLVRTTGS